MFIHTCFCAQVDYVITAFTERLRTARAQEHGIRADLVALLNARERLVSHISHLTAVVGGGANSLQQQHQQHHQQQLPIAVPNSPGPLMSTLSIASLVSPASPTASSSLSGSASALSSSSSSSSAGSGAMGAGDSGAPTPSLRDLALETSRARRILLKLFFCLVRAGLVVDRFASSANNGFSWWSSSSAHNAGLPGGPAAAKCLNAADLVVWALRGGLVPTVTDAHVLAQLFVKLGVTDLMSRGPPVDELAAATASALAITHAAEAEAAAAQQTDGRGGKRRGHRRRRNNKNNNNNNNNKNGDDTAMVVSTPTRGSRSQSLSQSHSQFQSLEVSRSNSHHTAPRALPAPSPLLLATFRFRLPAPTLEPILHSGWLIKVCKWRTYRRFFIFSSKLLMLSIYESEVPLAAAASAPPPGGKQFWLGGGATIKALDAVPASTVASPPNGAGHAAAHGGGDAHHHHGSSGGGGGSAVRPMGNIHGHGHGHANHATSQNNNSGHRGSHSGSASSANNSGGHRSASGYPIASSPAQAAAAAAAASRPRPPPQSGGGSGGGNGSAMNASLYPSFAPNPNLAYFYVTFPAAQYGERTLLLASQSPDERRRWLRALWLGGCACSLQSRRVVEALETVHLEQLVCADADTDEVFANISKSSNGSKNTSLVNVPEHDDDTQVAVADDECKSSSLPATGVTADSLLLAEDWLGETDVQDAAAAATAQPTPVLALPVAPAPAALAAAAAAAEAAAPPQLLAAASEPAVDLAKLSAFRVVRSLMRKRMVAALAAATPTQVGAHAISLPPLSAIAGGNSSLSANVAADVVGGGMGGACSSLFKTYLHEHSLMPLPTSPFDASIYLPNNTTTNDTNGNAATSSNKSDAPRLSHTASGNSTQSAGASASSSYAVPVADATHALNEFLDVVCAVSVPVNNSSNGDGGAAATTQPLSFPIAVAPAAPPGASGPHPAPLSPPLAADSGKPTKTADSSHFCSSSTSNSSSSSTSASATGSGSSKDLLQPLLSSLFAAAPLSPADFIAEINEDEATPCDDEEAGIGPNDSFSRSQSSTAAAALAAAVAAGPNPLEVSPAAAPWLFSPSGAPYYTARYSKMLHANPHTPPPEAVPALCLLSHRVVNVLTHDLVTKYADFAHKLNFVWSFCLMFMRAKQFSFNCKTNFSNTACLF